MPTDFSAQASGDGGLWDAKCYTFMTGLTVDGKRVTETVSKSELEAELARRNQQEKADVHATKNAEAERIMQNLDALLLLVPAHTGARFCSDDLPTYGVIGGCTRCVLIMAETDGFWRNDRKLVVTVEPDSAHASY